MVVLYQTMESIRAGSKGEIVVPVLAGTDEGSTTRKGSRRNKQEEHP